MLITNGFVVINKLAYTWCGWDRTDPTIKSLGHLVIWIY